MSSWPTHTNHSYHYHHHHHHHSSNNIFQFASRPSCQPRPQLPGDFLLKQLDFDLFQNKTFLQFSLFLNFFILTGNAMRRSTSCGPACSCVCRGAFLCLNADEYILAEINRNSCSVAITHPPTHEGWDPTHPLLPPRWELLCMVDMPPCHLPRSPTSPTYPAV